MRRSLVVLEEHGGSGLQSDLLGLLSLFWSRQQGVIGIMERSGGNGVHSLKLFQDKTQRLKPNLHKKGHVPNHSYHVMRGKNWTF